MMRTALLPVQALEAQVGLNDLFSDIADDQLVMQHKSADSALGKLVAAYSVHSRRIDRLPDMTITSVGADLKRGIAMLQPEEQVKLAYHYFLNQGVIEDESVEIADARKLRHWMIKAGVAVACAFTFLVMGAVLVFVNNHQAQQGKATDNSGIQVILSTAAEIAKILLSKE